MFLLFIRNRSIGVNNKLIIHFGFLGLLQDEWDSFLASITPHDGYTYQLYRRLLLKPVTQYLLIGPNDPLYSTNDKAEPFAHTFQDQFSPNFGIVLPEVTNSINQISNVRITYRDYTTPGTVVLIIKHLPNCKAPGVDQIINRALK